MTANSFIAVSVRRRPDRAKRAIDLIGASAILLLVSPILLVAAIAVRLTSKGPVLFRQERVGRDESIFMMVKFRTMIVNQAKVIDIAAIEAKAKDGVLTKMEDDPRITRVGKFLRRTSIDELPQLWNVVQGDMSLIGPRPLLPFMLAPYPDLRRDRSMVRPGLTGLWQVSTRSDNTTALGMADADLDYVANHNLRGDMKILWRTVPAIVKGSGAM